MTYARLVKRLPTALVCSALALAAVAFQGCGSATPDTAPVQCPSGQHEIGSSSSCAWDIVNVAIGPAVHGAGAWSGCPLFAPNPASAHKNGQVQWTNNTSATLTIYQYEGGNQPLPLATIAPGQTSSSFFWGTAGTVYVMMKDVAACYTTYLQTGHSGDPYLGAVIITEG